MFSLMDKVPNGIEPMLKDLEDHIISAGLADMVAAAETITTVRTIYPCVMADSQPLGVNVLVLVYVFL